MTNNLWRFGPSAPDGVYKQVVVSSDDRKVMPAHLDALREVIAHPDWYTTEEVTDAKATLPQLEQKYATAQDQKRSIRVRYARTDGGRGVVGAVTALDADLSIVLEVAAPWTETPKFQVARQPSGLDDSPVYADYQKVPKKGGSGDPRPNTNLTDVALNAYYALMAELLAKMARLQGKTADATRFEAIHDRIKTGVNARLWNEERGLYLSRYLDGGWNEVVTPTVFYPLLAGLATPERARVLVEDHLLDPKEFWGEYVIPSVARNDPKYCSGGPVHPQSEHFKFFKNYDDKGAPEEWKGAAWPPMNFTVYEGLKRYGFDREAGELAARSTAMYLNAYDRDGWFPESFDPEPGQSIMDSAVDTAWRTYSWSNAMAVQTIHELLSDEPWGDPEALMFGSLTLPGTNSVSNLVLRGHRYAITAGPRTTTVTRGGRPLFRSEGGRVAVRAFVLSEKGASFDITATASTNVEVVTGTGRTRSARVPTGHHHVEL